MRQLIILRPQPNIDKTLRLGLFKSAETDNRIENPVLGLKIDLGTRELVADEHMLSDYNHYGSFIGESINNWVLEMQYQNRELLLFEWWSENSIDYYRFLGSKNEIDKLFKSYAARLRPKTVQKD